MMTLDRFTALIDAWGADPARWPAAERAAALALLDASAEARAALEREKALDLALDAVPAPMPPSLALARKLGGLAREPRSLWADIAGLFGGWRLAGAALALCVAVGVAIGTAVPVGPEAESQVAADTSLLNYAILTQSYLDR